MKELVGFQHFNRLTLTFRRESVRPGSPHGTCLAVSQAGTRPLALSRPSMGAGVQAAPAGWRACWAGMQPRYPQGHLQESSPGPASVCASTSSRGRLPGQTFHCENKCSGRNGVATWTRALFPSQAQAALPSNHPPHRDGRSCVLASSLGLQGCTRLRRCRHPHKPPSAPAPRALGPVGKLRS